MYMKFKNEKFMYMKFKRIGQWVTIINSLLLLFSPISLVAVINIKTIWIINLINFSLLVVIIILNREAIWILNLFPLYVLV